MLNSTVRLAAFILILGSFSGGLFSQSSSAPAEAADIPEVSAIDAIQAVFRRNPGFLAQELNPSIQREGETVALSVFDPVVYAQVEYSKQAEERLARAGGGNEFEKTETILLESGVSAFLPSGTRVEASVLMEQDDSNLYNEKFSETSVGFSITQNLLRGYGSQVNLIRLRQARNTTKASWYELKAFAQALANEVLVSYWEYDLSRQEVEVFENALGLSRQRLEDTEARIEAGAAPRLDLPSVQAEVSSQEGGLLRAEARLEQMRLRLVRLMAPKMSSPWTYEFHPVPPENVLDYGLDSLEEHLEAAFRFRPDLTQARLDALNRELELVRTRNGLLPRLEVFASAGLSGYDQRLGRSAQNIRDDYYDLSVGAYVEYAIGNRNARAEDRRAILSYGEARLAIDNLKLVINEEIRSAYINIEALEKQIEAAEATLRFAKATYEAEEERFEAGGSTSFQVSQAQQNLLEAELSLIRAKADRRISIINLFTSEGTLLERLGILFSGPEYAGVVQ